MKRSVFLLILPFVLYASDIKFAVAASMGEEAKSYGASLADVIDEKLGIQTIRNFESAIYEDEAALYAVKNGIVKFAIVKSGLFAELGLKRDEDYGFEILSEQNGLCLVAQSGYLRSIAKSKKEGLLKALSKLKKES